MIKTDDNEEMYVSPLLAPAEKIEYDYLTNKDFKQGSYHCFSYFNYYASEKRSSYLGSMSAEINVEIDLGGFYYEFKKEYEKEFRNFICIGARYEYGFWVSGNRLCGRNYMAKGRIVK